MEKKSSLLGAKRRLMSCLIVRAVRKAVRSVRFSKYRRKNHVKTMAMPSLSHVRFSKYRPDIHGKAMAMLLHNIGDLDELSSGCSSDVGYFSREYKGHARMPIFVAGGGACTGHVGHSSSRSSHRR